MDAPAPVASTVAAASAVARAEADLHGTGRIVLRYSGTESLARVMVEAEDAGFTVAPYEKKLGWRGTNTGPIAFDNVPTWMSTRPCMLK